MVFFAKDMEEAIVIKETVATQKGIAPVPSN